MEGPEWGHSVFTYFLLEGLRKGTADLNSDGIIPATELYAYLDARVFRAAQEKGHQQRPVLWSMAAEEGEFVFITHLGSSLGGSSAERATIPSAPVSQAQAELAALQEQKRQVEEQMHQAELKQQMKMWQQLEEKKQKLEMVKAYGLPQQGSHQFVGKDDAPMVLIPAGVFQMGSSKGDTDERPVHRVGLDAFYLDKYEVTNQRFQQFVRETGYETQAEKDGYTYGCDLKSCKKIDGANWRIPEGGETVFVSNRETHPVVSVSWHDAEAYCRWTGKRLPTEAEFEYASLGGTTATHWWGNGDPGPQRVENIADEALARQKLTLAFDGEPPIKPPYVIGYDDGYARTAPVGSFTPNPFGLYDISGNVTEWTVDWYGKDYYRHSPERNPTGPSTGEEKVSRGGSWIMALEGQQSSRRAHSPPTVHAFLSGFRCAKTP